jgi:hypothetical protein
MPPFTPADPTVAASSSGGPSPGLAGVHASVHEWGTWARPTDRPSQVALALAVVLLAAAFAPGGLAWLGSVLDFAGTSDLTRRRRFLGIAGFVAAFLSLGYIAFYLRGGPRDALASVYWLQGRAVAHGELSWAAPEPTASFRAGHLLGAMPDRVAGILPPGYPLLLAAGFLVGAPMLIGPLLSAMLLIVTWALAREMALASGFARDRAEAIGRTAAGLSMVSVALRLFTADVLPFGAIAIAVSVALAAALRGRRLADRRFFALAGLAVGALVALQPTSAIATFAVVTAVVLGARDRRGLAGMLLAAVPGVLFLLAANRAAVGHALASPASVYASLFEGHAKEAVELKHGRLVTLLMQLRAHLADVDNLELLPLLALVPLLAPVPGSARSRPALLAGLVVGGQLAVAVVVGTAAGNAGAERRLVGVVPVEQALMALALAHLFPRVLARATVGVMGVALAGFALHVAPDHQRLAAADLGRPHYEPDVVRDANVAHGLLYFDDDQGFELAFDPEVPASHGIQAVRLRGDDHDRLLYDLLGHPQIHRYSATTAAATVIAWTPPNAGSDTWRFEAESDWPPTAASTARVEISEGDPACASDGHGLTVTPIAGSASGSVTLALPVPRGATPPERRSWSVAPRAIQRGGTGAATLVLVTAPDAAPLARWTWDDASRPAGTPVGPPQCIDLAPQTVELGGDRSRVWLVLEAAAGSVTLDKTTLRSR